MADNRHFDQLVKSGQPVGEVISVNRFIVRIKGLQPINPQSLVMFDDGSKGFVRHVDEDYVVVLHLGNTPITVGSLAVVQFNQLVSKVGEDYVGRVVTVTGEPLDGKGPIAADATWPVFNRAPGLSERELLNEQLESGITVIDSLFPLVHGQRIAILGDSKSGKSTIATQLAMNQARTDTLVVYALIAKRRSDIDKVLTELNQSGVMKKSIVVVSTMVDSLVVSYLAPYVACAMAEYLWQKTDQNVVVIYDDLTAHAHIYREIALLTGSSPGRESYPGDMFYTHSSLLERAGKLSRNHKSLTSLPIVLASGGDIAGYLPTTVMSSTDGQWVLDMDVFRRGLRPAINIGLSVTRVGGRGHNERQKQLSAQTMQMYAAYQKALQFAHFGAEIALETRRDLDRGRQLYDLFTQAPGERYPLLAQQLMLDIVLNLKAEETVDMSVLKQSVGDIVKLLKKDADYLQLRETLKTRSLLDRRGKS